MGIFSNPLAYVGAGPGVTGTPTTQNSTVRAATSAEAAAGVLNNCYISPATSDSSSTPRPVHATTLDSTSTTSLGTGSGSVINVGVANSTIGFFGTTPNTKPGSTADIRAALISLGLYTSGGSSPLNLNGGALTAGSSSLGSNALSVVNIGSATGTIGFFGATPATQPANTDDLRSALINLGLYTSGGATPLNLNGGDLACHNVSATGALSGNTLATASTSTIGDTLTLVLAGSKFNRSSVASTTSAGANSIGTVTLVGGTATISTTAVTASSMIRLWRESIGATGAAAIGTLVVGTRVVGTSFVINSVSAANATSNVASDVSVVGWEIIN